ncbi:hypothetical protein Ahy_B07g086684 isoform A [Arachis hypogaea]|uniref:ATP-dependent DNA helicase n=1 Tax=Arachis hypogaea TaxID=3818 RepID=A0A444YAK2_ARAHY|nr:hypothetical protein Ahy_B07g086684 isoform A [Arachis hypogaea]
MGSHQDIVQASISFSYLWQFCRVLKLSMYTRLIAGGIIVVDDDIKYFAEWLIKIGGVLAGDSTDGEFEIVIPEDILINDTDDGFQKLVSFVYAKLLPNLNNIDYFKKRTILAPTLEVVHELKVCVHVMLLRNIDPSNELCNGTRLQVRRLENHVIECNILRGDKSGKVVIISCMNMIPTMKLYHSKPLFIHGQ